MKNKKFSNLLVKSSISILTLATLAWLPVKQLFADAQQMPNNYDSPRSCFSPNGCCSEMGIEVITRTQKTLNLAVTDITNSNICNAINSAVERGVTVQLLASNNYLSAADSCIKSLKIKPKVSDLSLASSPEVIENNNKYLISDDLYIITGNYSFSTQGQSIKHENCIYLKDERKFYLNNFQHIYMSEK